MSLNPSNKTGTPIPWGDATEDKFYIDLALVGEGSDAKVTSDANLTEIGRSKTVCFNTYSNSPNHRLCMTVVQGPDSLVSATFDEYSSVYQGRKAGYTETE